MFSSIPGDRRFAACCLRIFWTICLVPSRRKDIFGCFESLNSIYHVASDPRGDIVGFATGGPTRHPDFQYQNELYAIYVQASHQGSGIGTTLFRALADDLHRSNRTGLIWSGCWSTIPIVVFTSGMVERWLNANRLPWLLQQSTRSPMAGTRSRLNSIVSSVNAASPDPAAENHTTGRISCGASAAITH